MKKKLDPKSVVRRGESEPPAKTMPKRTPRKGGKFMGKKSPSHVAGD